MLRLNGKRSDRALVDIVSDHYLFSNSQTRAESLTQVLCNSESVNVSTRFSLSQSRTIATVDSSQGPPINQNAGQSHATSYGVYHVPPAGNSQHIQYSPTLAHRAGCGGTGGATAGGGGRGLTGVVPMGGGHGGIGGGAPTNVGYGGGSGQ